MKNTINLNKEEVSQLLKGEYKVEKVFCFGITHFKYSDCDEKDLEQVDEVIRFLEKKGYRKVRQAGTSHALYTNMKTQHCIPVPIHGKEINAELAYGIQRQVYQAKNN